MYRPVPARSASQQVADQIRELVDNGQIKPGDKLPSEQELARQFAVGRSSVREAIRSLVSLGILEVRHGYGTFVAQVPSKVDPLPWLLANRENVLEILEAREALEPKSAWLAAQRATAEQVEQLTEINREMELASYQSEVPRLEILDRLFHEQVAEMSHNRFLQKLTQLANTAMRDRRAVLALPGRALQSVREHFAVVEAIRNRDPDAARDRMAAHIEGVKDLVRHVRGLDKGR